MIKQLSNNIAFFLLRQNIIPKEDEEIYAYGLEYIISVLISMIGISIISIIMGCILETIGFILGFILIRSVSGGYHATTHMRCQIASYVVYLINMVMLNLIEKYLNNMFIATLLILLIILIFVFAPMDHPNKPFSNKEYLYFKKKSRQVVIILSIISLL